METKKRYMVGNLVINKRSGEIIEIESTSKIGIKYDENGLCCTFLPYEDIKGIPLSDEFFEKNGYEISDSQEDSQERIVQHIMAKDHYGPAVTKYIEKTGRLWHTNKIEYCVTGIIIRTVDDFQNMMNLCHCEDIAKKIKA